MSASNNIITVTASATTPKLSPKNLSVPGGSKTAATATGIPAGLVTTETAHQQITVANTAVVLADQSNLNPVVTSHAPIAQDMRNPVPLDTLSFPNQPHPGCSQLPGTLANTTHLLASYGVTASYDVIKKKLSVSVPNVSGTPDNADNVAMAYVVSLASLNRLPTAQLFSYIATIGDRNQTNPAATWITSKPWDSNDRLAAFVDTLVHRDGFASGLKTQLVKRWLISAVAAALKPIGFKARGVLTLQGPQSIGKTSWIQALVPNSYLCEHLIKLDHHLDAGNKDSILTAVSHWIVEIGELDSSFKNDIARLKGFLTNGKDKMRRPYGRTDSEYPRRTVFCATVNEESFLVDSTGNTRWWTIPVTSINYNHGIDMQQLFAQMAVDFEHGEQWWLTSEEETHLEHYNQAHRVINVIADRVLQAIDLSRCGAPNLPAMTPSALLIKIGIRNPSNTQAKECAAILREYIGCSKRVNGRDSWRVPLKSENAAEVTRLDDDDLY